MTRSKPRRDPMPLPSQARLRELFDYDPATGKLTTKDGRAALWWKGSKGYLCGNLEGQRVYAHRVIWKWLHGTEPPQVDHRNGNRQDNRKDNLRAASHAINAKNAAKRQDNTSGHCGVSWNKRKSRWVAYIRVDNRRIHLGYHLSKDAAVTKRQAAEREHGFSERHGT